MHVRSLALTAALLCLGPKAHADDQLLKQVIVDGSPVAPPPLKRDGTLIPGSGLCGSYKPTKDPLSHFPFRTMSWPADAADLPTSLNNFMDVGIASGADGTRKDAVLRTPFDLTNNYSFFGSEAAGDFVNTPGCPGPNGCDFPAAAGADLSTGFGARFRGLFYVRPDWVGQPLHFGLFADNAVALLVYAVPKAPDPPRPLREYLLVSRALGPNPQVRVTNQITFFKPGLYPIEVLYGQYDNAAVLEMAVLFSSSFKDIDEESNLGQPKLGQSGFDLSYTMPANFYMTENAQPAFPADPTECQQCPRTSYGTTPPIPVCEAGYHCNAAALCVPDVTTPAGPDSTDPDAMTPGSGGNNLADAAGCAMAPRHPLASGGSLVVIIIVGAAAARRRRRSRSTSAR